jgi:hypothetical protein
MAQSATTRAPRGTKVLAKAFFTAAEEFPEARRLDVIKAALVAIRDQLKVAREKAPPERGKSRPANVVAAAPKKMGRPHGSKSKPMKTPVTAKKAASNVVKNLVRKATTPKKVRLAPVMQIATE